MSTADTTASKPMIPRGMRTPEEPMAFTRQELWRGGRRTWYFFLIELCLLMIVPSIVNELAIPADQRHGWNSYLAMIPLYVLYALLVGAPISFLAMLAATPLAGLIGTAMRRIRARTPHVLAQATLGALVGAVVMALVILLSARGIFSASVISTYAGVGAPFTAVAAALGWWSTAHSALRDDSGIGMRAGSTAPH